MVSKIKLFFVINRQSLVNNLTNLGTNGMQASPDKHICLTLSSVETETEENVT